MPQGPLASSSSVQFTSYSCQCEFGARVSSVQPTHTPLYGLSRQLGVSSPRAGRCPWPSIRMRKTPDVQRFK
jgi:hypothetical protein